MGKIYENAYELIGGTPILRLKKTKEKFVSQFWTKTIHRWWNERDWEKVVAIAEQLKEGDGEWHLMK